MPDQHQLHLKNSIEKNPTPPQALGFDSLCFRA